MTSVLVLGYRQGIDEAIRRRGLEPFFVVERPKPQLAGRDYYLQVANLEDAQEVLRAVASRGLRGVAAVVTGHEEAVFSTALIRSALGLPGDADYLRTLRFRDKYLQKSALPSSIPRAECGYVTPKSSYADVVAQTGTPFVIKPANGFGAERTSVVGTSDQLASYWNGDAASDVRTVVESFIDGEELHVDGVWRDRRLVWSCVSRYVQPPIRWNEGAVLGDVLVSSADRPDLCAEAETLTEQALRGLDAPDSVFHLEAFRCAAGRYAGRLVFGECAVRIGGGMISEAVSLTFGVDLCDMAVSLALEEPIDLPGKAHAPDYYYGYVFLRRMPGVTLTEDDLRRSVPGVYEIEYPAEPDARVGAYGRVGYAMLCDRDSNRLYRHVSKLAALNEQGSEKPALSASHD